MVEDLNVLDGTEEIFAAAEALSDEDDNVDEFSETITPEKKSRIRLLVSLLVTGRSPYCSLLSSRLSSLLIHYFLEII